ncbi:hypothetical protein E4U58_004743 [Claviceps cyperi]|nr:hypothetical protein E4U58_004743 [Claviceps cyperi]
MFGFWSAETRGSDQTVESIQDLSFDGDQPTGATDASSPPAISSPPACKRRRLSLEDAHAALPMQPPNKRAKLNSSRPIDASGADGTAGSSPSTAGRVERACEVIEHQVGLEVLLKHSELRLINQEIAKCQVALEQLRRCHLIPYPQNCPTPDQMLDIVAGKGPAVITRFGESVPHWAPPFGVVDGPYARHYSKWLIPDPAFDGPEADWQIPAESTRSRVALAEGRQTRYSITEKGPVPKGRSNRANAGQKLQALSNGYPQPKDKVGPCVVKRSDGQTVKLVCVDCQRENFSSTQGFINHCRIAHKRDFKSHEEAAFKCGQPMETGGNHDCGGDSNATPAVAAQSSTTNASTWATALVHPFARQDISEQEAYLALQSRISDALKLYHQGKAVEGAPLPLQSTGVQVSGLRRSTAAAASPRFDHVLEIPHLSSLMQRRKFGGNLSDVVADAKTKVSLEDMTPDEESDDASSPSATALDGPAPARTPVVKRVPVQSSTTAVSDSPDHSASSISHARLISPASIAEPTGGVSTKTAPLGICSDEDMDDMEEADLSPNPLASNIAPSLVSDDGENDDSDDGSSISGGSDELDTQSVSDVAEITLDDEQDARTHRRDSKGVPGTVRLRKHDAKKQHVTILGPVKKHGEKRKSHRN